MAHCRGAAQSCRFHNGRGKKSACMAVRDRHAGWQYLRYAFCGVKLSSLSFRGAKRRGNLTGPGPITGKPRRKRNCLPEIAPQGHFLALRAQGATSAFGLLAMTREGDAAVHQRPSTVECPCTGRLRSAATDAIGAYHFNDNLYQLAALRRGRLSPLLQGARTPVTSNTKIGPAHLGEPVRFLRSRRFFIAAGGLGRGVRGRFRRLRLRGLFRRAFRRAFRRLRRRLRGGLRLLDELGDQTVAPVVA